MPYGVKEVTAEEFARRMNEVVVVLRNALGSVIMPIASFGMLVSVGLFIIGACVHHQMLKKMGLIGTCVIMGGVIFYFASPVFMGFAVKIGHILGR